MPGASGRDGAAGLGPSACRRAARRAPSHEEAGLDAGEWISSLALEQALLESPGVADVAVVAVPHERWQERPVAVVVPDADGVDTTKVLAALDGRVPRWWCPDRVEIVDALPRTSVGKVDKRRLRGALREAHLGGSHKLGGDDDSRGHAGNS
jgi:fatty-acyl-CoA synthase